MPHRSTLRGRVWKLTDLWTQRTRPQILAKPQNGFAQAPTRLIAFPFFRRPKDQNTIVRCVSYPQILRRRHKPYAFLSYTVLALANVTSNPPTTPDTPAAN